MVAKVEIEHEQRYLRLLERLTNGQEFSGEEEEEWQCMHCGYVHKGKSAPKRCPVCGKEQRLLLSAKPKTIDHTSFIHFSNPNSQGLYRRSIPIQPSFYIQTHADLQGGGQYESYPRSGANKHRSGHVINSETLNAISYF